jgi:hypothetical protein
MYTDLRESPDHQRAIAFLAAESQVPIDVITRLYADEQAKLEVGARISGFIPILTIRNVRRQLRQPSVAPANGHSLRDRSELESI